MATQLPDELLLVVFSLVPTTDRVTCLRVCQQWRRIALDRTLWRGAPLDRHSDPPRGVPSGWVTFGEAILVASAHRMATLSADAASAQEGENGLRLSVAIDPYERLSRRDKLEAPRESFSGSESEDPPEDEEDERVLLATSAHEAGLLPPGALGGIISQCVVRLREEGAMEHVWTALAGEALKSLGVWWGGSMTELDSESFVEALEAFPRLDFLSCDVHLDDELFHQLFTLAQPALSLRYRSTRISVFEHELVRSSTLIGVDLTLGGVIEESEMGFFSAARFPALRLLAVRGMKGRHQHIYMGERELFRGKARGTKHVPSLLEELTLNMSFGEKELTELYPSLRCLTLYDRGRLQSASTLSRFSDPRKQLPLLEELACVWPTLTDNISFVRTEEWFSWWEELLDVRTGPPNLREIRTFSRPPEMAIPGVSELHDHSKTRFRDLALPVPVREGEAASVCHVMPRGYSLTITVCGEEIQYRAVRTPATT